MPVATARAAMALAVLAALASVVLFGIVGAQRAAAVRSTLRDEALTQATEQLAELRSAVTSLATLGTASLATSGPADDGAVLAQIVRAGEALGVSAAITSEAMLDGWSVGPSPTDPSVDIWALRYGVPVESGAPSEAPRLVLSVPLEELRTHLADSVADTTLLYRSDGEVFVDSRRPIASGGALPSTRLELGDPLLIDGRPAVSRPVGGATRLHVAVADATGPTFVSPGPGTTVPALIVFLSAVVGALALRSSERRRRLAEERDPITGLINRSTFERELRLESATAIAVLRIDITPLGGLDDLGDADHVDAVLLAAGTRLARTVRPSDTIARTGHREFAIIARDVPDKETAELVGHRLRSRVGTSLRVMGSDIPLVTSVGVAFEEDSSTPTLTLAARAGAALDQARLGHRPVVVHVGGTSPLTPAGLAAELRSALAAGEVETHLQPVIDPSTGQVTHVEALARWTHAVHGFIPPDVFVPAAESTGVIGELTAYVLESCIRRVVDWRDRGIDVGIAVNVSTVDLDVGFADKVDLLLRTYGCPPSRIRLEVTETAVVHDLARVQTVLTDLHERGISIDVDDFGTGHASLAYVRGFPVSGVKIDRQFVSSMLESRTDALIVRSSIELVHALGMSITAEGVEDEMTLEALRSWGCDRAQGYHIARPMPPAELESMFDDGRLSAARLTV